MLIVPGINHKPFILRSAPYRTKNMKSPIKGLIEEEDLLLATDYYELTSGRANSDFNHDPVITEYYFFRSFPSTMPGFVITAGLEQFMGYVETLQSSKNTKAIDFLLRTSGGDINTKFAEYLKNAKFNITVNAIPEGTPVFPGEPIISITGKSIEVQILETYLLMCENFQSLVATKSARIRSVVGKDSYVEFGARRAHSPQAALWGARAAYIGGSDGTSYVTAAEKFDIPYVGTMPHKFIQERFDGKSFYKTELKAFEEYAKAFPHNSLLLIDTYNSINGVINAIIVARGLKEKGYNLKGVRLDSGDLDALSRTVRQMLNSAGLNECKIYGTNDLDEYEIKKLKDKAAPINGWGVGTRVITGANYNPNTGMGGTSALGGVFKLSMVDGKPSMKFSNDRKKQTLGGDLTTWRGYDERGMYIGDTVGLSDEVFVLHNEGWVAKKIMVPIMVEGKMVYDFPAVKEIRAYCMKELSKLKPVYKEIYMDAVTNPPHYAVKYSKKVENCKAEMTKIYNEEFGEGKKVIDEWKTREREIIDQIEKHLDWEMDPNAI